MWIEKLWSVNKKKRKKDNNEKKKEKRSEIIRRGGGVRATSRQISISIRNQALFLVPLLLAVYGIRSSLSFHISGPL